ncbi:sigma-70 family RNA polymerase sigma factor [Sphingobacterium sp. LRF_L2]|uniref:sigma-70 family RNA polymerase sigma factor n=1 Tax=Sphingobacterium sp. LRF_L2 TaxID=3369421 RepID=UPI003F60BC13
MNEQLEPFSCQIIDQESFKVIYELYWDKVLQYAQNIVGDESLAEDILQHVFISLWDRRSYLSITNVEAYLKRAVKFSAIHEIKRRLKMDSEVDLQDVTLSAYQDSDNEILYKDLQLVINQLLRSFPSNSQRIFQLKFQEGLDNRAIAEKLQMSEKTIRNQLSLCLKTVRVKLKKAGF